ncbi:hypothetical protein ACFSUS_15680 [Spirosoma soli]|uniref:Uncharacterized protein n=1 Tax=Spirosoma soli TaxID=1770529 RepID=A0ABW5M512_9BACT
MNTSLAKALFSTSCRRYWTTQVVYVAASCLILLAILSLPMNRAWLAGTIGTFYRQRQLLGTRTDLDSRKRAGYGVAYTYTSLIRQHCRPGDYFLIPPQRYLIQNAYAQDKATGFAWIYPSVLYYHLGKSVHLLEMTSPDSLLQRATHTFGVQSNKLVLLAITDQNRAAVLAQFRRYDPRFFAYTPDQARRYYKAQAKP